MSNRLLIGIIVLLLSAYTGYMLLSARKAKQQSDQILEDFKTIDNSLKSSHDSIQKANDSLLHHLKKIK